MFDSRNHMSIFSNIITLPLSIYRDCIFLISPSTTHRYYVSRECFVSTDDSQSTTAFLHTLNKVLVTNLQCLRII